MYIVYIVHVEIMESINYNYIVITLYINDINKLDLDYLLIHAVCVCLFCTWKYFLFCYIFSKTSLLLILN